MACSDFRKAMRMPTASTRALVRRLPSDLAFCWLLCSVLRGRLARTSPGAAEPVERVLGRAPSSLPAFAVPDNRRRLGIPASCRLLKPAPDLGRAVRMLPGERAALEHALNRLGHVEPAAAHGRVQRHHAMRTQ